MIVKMMVSQSLMITERYNYNATAPPRPPFAGSKCAASFVDRCITFVGENAAECVKTTAFLNLNKDGLTKLISSDYVSGMFVLIIPSYHSTGA